MPWVTRWETSTELLIVVKQENVRKYPYSCTYILHIYVEKWLLSRFNVKPLDCSIRTWELLIVDAFHPGRAVEVLTLATIYPKGDSEHSFFCVRLSFGIPIKTHSWEHFRASSRWADSLRKRLSFEYPGTRPTCRRDLMVVKCSPWRLCS